MGTHHGEETPPYAKTKVVFQERLTDSGAATLEELQLNPISRYIQIGFAPSQTLSGMNTGGKAQWQ